MALAVFGEHTQSPYKFYPYNYFKVGVIIPLLPVKQLKYNTLKKHKGFLEIRRKIDF